MIYTAITGNKDPLRDDIKCFTEGYKFDNPRLNARMYKILSHLFLNDKWTIWIDGNIRLFVSENQLIEMTKPYEVGVFTHPERNCIYEEGQFCKKIGKGDSDRIDRQLVGYSNAGYPMNNGLAATFIVVRKNTPHVNRLNEMWWEHITRYSIRDQLSFPPVFDGNFKYLPKVPMRKNKYFKRLRHGK